MKKSLFNIAYMAVALAGLTACSDEIFSSSSSGDGENVTINLSYADCAPKSIVINSRSTDDDLQKLDNLYIYVFDAKGNLKGYKGITNSSDLAQNTYTTDGTISNLKTTAGESYIYAVANVNTTLYSIPTSSGSVEANKLPIGLDEDKARNGDYTFTLSDLKNLKFNRTSTDIDITDGRYLMGGSMANGNKVEIVKSGNGENGSITYNNSTVDKIELTHVVSQVNFNISTYSGDKTKRTFELQSYDVINIPKTGDIIGNLDGNSIEITNGENENKTGLKLSVNESEAVNKTFSFFLPENLQVLGSNMTAPTKWEEREDDGMNTTSHTFTKAPVNATYVKLNGKYSEVNESGVGRTANVTYYIHLGGCDGTEVKPADFNFTRNCKYTYNVTVKGVDKIIVEAKRENGENQKPGSEGIVIEGTAKTLDSHYDYTTLTFNKSAIEALKNQGHGLFFQVHQLGKKTKVIEVKDQDITESDLNGVSLDWITFGEGQLTNATYPAEANRMKLVDLLKKLYSKTDWNNDGTYTVTCFLDENYYSDKKWSEFTNDNPKRSFYIADAINVSKDGRSIYAKAQYAVEQENIQTIYKSSTTGAVYGVETTDEYGVPTVTNWKVDNSNNYDAFNGHINQLYDLGMSNDTEKEWSDYAHYSSNDPEVQCMSRNRDLNGDGKITKDEVRWYCPTMAQYAGVWLGESSITPKSRLYNQSTENLSDATRKLYFATTVGMHNYFSEEGMATGNTVNDKTWSARYIKCARNMENNKVGYDANQLTKYYTLTDKTIELTNMSVNAYMESGNTELSDHTEQSCKPAYKFTVASNFTSYTVDMEKVVAGTDNCSNYTQTGTEGWRVPNVREYGLIFVALDNKTGNYLVNKHTNNNSRYNNKTTYYPTFCRTKFSNPNFRYTWTCNPGNNDYGMGMETTDYKSALENNGTYGTGYLRCIHVMTGN